MAKEKKNFGLGKGLGSLLPSQVIIEEDGVHFVEPESSIFAEIELNKIKFNPYQPRKEFDEKSLEELAESIRQNGLIQPITVRKVDTGYQLISGERRVRAAFKAGLTKIPAYIIKVEEDFKLLELAIIENVQRKDLDPIELANGYKRLIEECGLTHEQVAERVGKDRSTVTNFVRLLKLPIPVQESLKKNEISIGHAKVLLSLEEPELIKKVCQKIIQENLSVRDTETLVNELLSIEVEKSKQKIAGSKQPNPELLNFQDLLMKHLGTKVTIKESGKNKGKIIIEFYSNDDFERIVESLLNR